MNAARLRIYSCSLWSSGLTTAKRRVAVFELSSLRVAVTVASPTATAETLPSAETSTTPVGLTENSTFAGSRAFSPEIDHFSNAEIVAGSPST